MTLNDILDEIYVINLESRKDRLKNAENQFSQIGSYFTRIEACKVDSKIKSVENAMSHSWINTLEKAIANKHEIIAICEDDLVFRRKIVEDLPELATHIANTDFEVLSAHHYAEHFETSKKLLNTPEASEVFLKPVKRKPWCNHFLILKNLSMWLDHLKYTVSNNPKRNFDHTLTVFNTKSYVTSREYCFQLDDFSTVQNRVKIRFEQKKRYSDIIL